MFAAHRSRRPLWMAMALLAALLAALVFAGFANTPEASAASTCGAVDARPGTVTLRSLRRATVCLLNRERARYGRPQLGKSLRLGVAASRHAYDMVKYSYFAHDSRSGASFLDRIRRTGYLSRARSWAAGENIAWGSGSRGTPRSIVAAWMRSSGHRHNILSRNFRHIGIGVAPGAPGWRGSGAATYVTDFGRR